MKTLILTDSHCDLSMKLDNVYVMNRKVYLKGMDIEFNDTWNIMYNRNFLKMVELGNELETITLPCTEFNNAYEYALENEVTDIIVLIPENTIYRGTMVKYYNFINTMYDRKINIYPVDVHVDSIALGLLVSDINTFIDEGYSIASIIEYVKEHQDQYEYLVTTRNIINNNIITAFKVASIMDTNSIPIYQSDKNGKLKLKSIADEELFQNDEIVRLLKQKDIEDTVLYVVTEDEDDAFLLRNKVCRENLAAFSDTTKFGKINGSKFGTSSIGIAYKKKRV